MIKRLAGLLVVVVGLAGLSLCGLAVARTWTTGQQLRRQSPQVLEQLVELVRSIQLQAETASSLLTSARGRVMLAQTLVEDLAPATDRRRLAPSTLDTLDHDIVRRLEDAENFVQSLEATMRSMSSAVLLLDSMPFLSLRRSTPEADINLRLMADNLAETATRLQQVAETLAQIRSREAISPRQLTQVRDALHYVDGNLVEVQAAIDQFVQAVEQATERTADVQARAPRWITTTMVLAMAFFVCFGFSQVHLVVWGGKLVFGV